MGILDLSNENKEPVKEETPVVKEEQPVKEKTIILDGPLSTIYTKALNLVFSKDKPAISSESQQIDAIMIADAHNFSKKMNSLSNIREKHEAAYVYVTDNEIINSDSGDSFDELRIALDSNTEMKKIICIEDISSNPSKRSLVFVDYISKHPSKPEIYFNRDNLIERLKNI